MKQKMITTVKASNLEDMLSEALITSLGKSIKLVDTDASVSKDDTTLLEGEVDYREAVSNEPAMWSEVEHATFEINIGEREGTYSINPVEVVIEEK